MLRYHEHAPLRVVKLLVFVLYEVLQYLIDNGLP